MITEKKEHIPQVYDTGLAYLDPMSCGSMIAYHINGRKTYFDATITLTDCSRKIDWEFDNSMQSVGKDRQCDCHSYAVSQIFSKST